MEDNMLPDDDLVERFAGVGVWRSGGQRAPHKPLLLLLALARLLRGEERLIAYTHVHKQLERLLRDFGPPRKAHHPNFPFWRLQNDGQLWEVPERQALLAGGALRTSGDVPVSELRRHNARGGFPGELFEHLRARQELAARISARILQDHFAPSLHEDLLNAVAMPWVQVGGLARRRDPAFREAILRSYEHRCAVCGYDGRLGSSDLAIEAAHVMWHAAGGPDRGDNGLALCSFHHKAFDRGALGLSPDLKVLVSQDVHGSHAVDDWILRYAHQPLRAPQVGQPVPDERFVEWHRREVFRQPPRVAS